MGSTRTLYSSYNSRIMYISFERKAIILLEGKYAGSLYDFKELRFTEKYNDKFISLDGLKSFEVQLNRVMCPLV